jgi:hypothetical protein
MRWRELAVLIAMAGILVLGAVSVASVRAAGYWNVPGTHAQRAGHGYGGGYHAPLILGPVRYDAWSLGAPVRLPCAPSPYYACGNCGDCGRCGQMVESPSSMEGFVPTTAPATTFDRGNLEPEPAVELVRPLFSPPVQR